MNKRTHADLVPTPIFAGKGLFPQDKNQHFLAFIPIPSETRNLVVVAAASNRTPALLAFEGSCIEWCRNASIRICSQSGRGSSLAQTLESVGDFVLHEVAVPGRPISIEDLECRAEGFDGLFQADRATFPLS